MSLTGLGTRGSACCAPIPLYSYPHPFPSHCASVLLCPHPIVSPLQIRVRDEGTMKQGMQWDRENNGRGTLWDGNQVISQFFFEPSQPQRIISELKTNFSLSPTPSYFVHKLSNHKLSRIPNIMQNKTYQQQIPVEGGLQGRHRQWLFSCVFFYLPSSRVNSYSTHFTTLGLYIMH